MPDEDKTLSSSLVLDVMTSRKHTIALLLWIRFSMGVLFFFSSHLYYTTNKIKLCLQWKEIDYSVATD